ncbi:MAG: DUF2959 domain-containing protein [Desulfobulbaceae bacterium]|nr:DUF2959 domain-containing protein [Desulfobulbaceae bacterium]
MSFFLILCAIALMFLATSCSSAYYNTMEKFGVHKRDIMVNRVKEARDAQTETKEQFKSALEQFTEVVQVRGGNLEAQYKKLNSEYERSKGKADQVHQRIDAVESVSEALFREWKAELKQYTNASLRQDSERKLESTRRQYEQLITAMKRAESKIQPVLTIFHDQVLYLKHNLNAQAIASLQGELLSLERNVDQLVREMEESIREADLFITRLQQS